MNLTTKKVIRKSTSLLLSILLVISMLVVGAVSAGAATIPASTDFYFDSSNASSFFGSVYMSVTSSANSNYAANSVDASGANSYYPGGDTWYTMTNIGGSVWKATVTVSSAVGKVSFWSVNENNYNQVWQVNCSLANSYDGTNNLFTVGSAYSSNSGRQSKCFSGTWSQYGNTANPVFTNSTTSVTAQVNTTVTLDSAATIGNGVTPTYSTTCSNSNVTIGSATTAAPTFTATATGTYTVVTTATNPNTSQTATKTYTVTVINTAVIPANTDFYFDASSASSYFGTVYMSLTSSANSNYSANASDTSGANSYSPVGDTWYTMTNLGNNLWKVTVTASSAVGKVSFWSVNENNYNQVWQANCSLGNTYDGTNNLFTVGSTYAINTGRQSKCFSGTWSHYGSPVTTFAFTDSTTTATTQINAPITLNSAATISDGTTPTYLTTCSDTSVTIGSATTASPTFTSTATGTYTVVTTATNPNTKQTVTKTYTITVETNITSVITLKTTITPASGLVGDNFQIGAYVNKFANAVAGTAYTYVITVKVDGTECSYVNSDNITTALKETITAQYTPATKGTKNVSISAIAYTDYGTAAQTAVAIGSTTATIQVAKYAASFAEDNRIYARAVAGSTDMESWAAAEDASISYSSLDTSVSPSLGSTNATDFRIFLPTSASDSQVEVLNTYSSSITVGTTEIQEGKTAVISYTPGTAQTLIIGTSTTPHTLTFYKSTTEGAVYVNDSSKTASQLVTKLYSGKDSGETTSITGGVASGSTSTAVGVKKIKGRGNTTWTNTGKKSFNVTYSSAVTVAGLTGTKFSLLANFQDPSLARNRMVLDLADQIGVDYATDSRFVDFYLNGLYMGSYLMTQKIEMGTGKNYVVGDVDSLNYDNITTAAGVPSNFNFLIEVDSNASDENGDFWVQSAITDNKITIKSPEYLESDLGTSYHADVATAIKNNVRDKFDAMYTAIANDVSNLSDYVDVDSLTRYYLVNELVKNYDIGVTSTYFVYKQDANGNWKFFASPVWDYDNSMGNCAGDGESYQSYENDWTNTKTFPSNQNIMNKAAQNSTVQAAAPSIWFDDIYPAIVNNINATSSTYNTTVNLQSANYYISSLSESFTNNFRKWSLINNNGWITDHSSLTKATFNNSTGAYTVATAPTTYNVNTVAGQVNYAVDWLTSRAAWMSQKYYVIGTTPVFSNGTTAYNTYLNTALTLNSTAAVSEGTISYSTSCDSQDVTISDSTTSHPVFTASATGDYTVTTTATNTSTNEVSTKTYTITVSSQPVYANYYVTGPGEISAQTWGTWTQMNLSSDGTYAYAQITPGTEFKISNTASYDDYTGLSIDTSLNEGATLTGSLSSGAGTNLNATISSGYTSPLYICVNVSTGNVYVKATAE